MAYKLLANGYPEGQEESYAQSLCEFEMCQTFPQA